MPHPIQVALAIDTAPLMAGVKTARATAGQGAGFERVLTGLTARENPGPEKPGFCSAAPTPGAEVSQAADEPIARDDASGAAAVMPEPSPIIVAAQIVATPIAATPIATVPGSPPQPAKSPAKDVGPKQPPGAPPIPLGPAPEQTAVQPSIHPAGDRPPATLPDAVAHDAPTAPAMAVATHGVPEPLATRPDAASVPALQATHPEGRPSPGVADQPLAKLADLVAAASQAAPASVTGIVTAPPPPSIPAHVAQAPAASPEVAAAPPAPYTAAPIAPALVHIGRTDAVQHLTVRLNPAELGRVEVRIERAATGPAKIELSAGRQETLDLMRQDQPALHRALDQAGVPAEGRQVTFSLDPDLAGQEGGSGTAFSGTGFPGGGFPGGGSSGGSPQPGGGRPEARFPIPAGAWRRAGIDVLA